MSTQAFMNEMQTRAALDLQTDRLELHAQRVDINANIYQL